MASTGQELRLSELDLPLRAVEMVQSLSAPSAEDLEYLESTLQDYCGRLSMIQRLIQIEEITNSRMARMLEKAEASAQFRVIALRNVRAAWRSGDLALLLDEARTAPSRVLLGPSWRSSGSGARLQDQDWSAMQMVLPFLTVCKWWKAAALSTTAARASVVVPLVAKQSVVGNIPFVPTRLARHLVSRLQLITDGHIPWSLSISSNGMISEESNSVNGLPLSSMLTPFRLASPSLKLLKVNTTYFGDLLHERGSTFPSVSSLVLLTSTVPTRRTSYRLGSSPHFANLEKLTIIDSIDADTATLPQAVPWAQLTHLLIQDNLPLDGVKALLILCNSLQEVCICIPQANLNTATTSWCSVSPTTTIMQPHLRALSIVHNEPIHDTFFENFSFPSLARLRNFCHSFNTNNQSPFFSSFVPSLTHLTLKFSAGNFDLSNTPYGIAIILYYSPNLVHLAVFVDKLGVLGPILERLVLLPEQLLARNLQVLALFQQIGSALSYFSSPRFPVQTLFDVVTSRRRHFASGGEPPSFKRVLVYIYGSGIALMERRYAETQLDSVAATLQPLIADGLESDVRVLVRAQAGSVPSPEAKHWDYGAMDFIDHDWEFGTTLPSDRLV